MLTPHWSRFVFRSIPDPIPLSLCILLGVLLIFATIDEYLILSLTDTIEPQMFWTILREADLGFRVAEFCAYCAGRVVACARSRWDDVTRPKNRSSQPMLKKN